MFSKDDIRRAQQAFNDKMAKADPQLNIPSAPAKKPANLGAIMQRHADQGQIDQYRSLTTARKCGANRRR